MRLFGIEPHPAIDQMALRTYVCIDCDAVQTDLISTRADADQGALTDLADQGALNGGELTISIVGHLTNSGFDDATTRLLGEAFDSAWQRVKDSGSPLGAEPCMASTRELLAKRVVESVLQGETDGNRLVEDALAFLLESSQPAASSLSHLACPLQHRKGS